MQQGNQDKVVAIVPVRGGLGAVQRGQLISRLREQLRDALMQRIRVMLENVDDAFFARADKAESNQQQALYFEAMREIRLKRSSIEGDFVAGVLKEFERSLTPGSRNRVQAGGGDDEGELSLVETDELEQRLATDGMAGKAKRLYSEDLYLIGQRLAALGSQTAPSAEDDIAIGPRTVCEAFNEAAAVLEMSIQPKLVLYKLFDRFVVGELGDVYGGFNLMLREAGLLPNLRVEEHSGGRSRRGSAGSPRGGASVGGNGNSAQGGNDYYEDEGNDELAAALQAFLGSVRSQGRGPGGGYGYAGGAPMIVSGHELVGALTQLQQAAHAADSGVVPLAPDMLKDELRQAVGAGGTGTQAFTPVDENTIDIVAMLFDFIFEDPALPEPFKGLIARLQIPMVKVALLDRSFLTRKHHPARRLLNLMAHAGIGWMPGAGQGAEDLLARVEQMVNRVVDEFEDDTQIFEKVLADFEPHLDSEEHAAQERESAEAEQAMRRENREIGRVVASAAIDQVLVGSRVPDAVETFLRGPWRDLMAGIYASSGSESTPWMKALNIASTLVWSLMPKETDEARAQLLDTLPNILRALRDGMEKLNVPAEKREALFACLALEHSRLARIARRPAPEPMPAESRHAVAAPFSDAAAGAEAVPSVGSGLESVSGPLPAVSVDTDTDVLSSVDRTEEVLATPEPELDQKSFMARKTDEIKRMIAEGRFRGSEAVTPNLGDESGEVVLDEFMDCAESLEEGTWLDWTDANGLEQRIKLSWRSIISNKYFFVNRQGMKVVEMTPQALATELRETRARIIEDAPVVDRALISALDSLKQTEG
jgi:hypothetical protein